LFFDMYAFRVVHEGLYHKPGRRARLDAGRHLGVSRRPRGGAARPVFRVRRRRRTLPQLVIATRSDERASLTVGFIARLDVEEHKQPLARWCPA